MIEGILIAIIFFALGNIVERKHAPRHRHVYEVVDRKEIPSPAEIAGQNPTQMIADVKMLSFEYSPNTSSLERLTHRGEIVHYRCYCGAERIERL